MGRKMRKVIDFLKSEYGIVMLLILLAVLCLCMGCEGGNWSYAAVVAGATGVGKLVSDEPLTTDITREESPDLLLNEIDSRIVKIRPMSTPIDQLSRLAGARKAGSMIVDFYSVDTKPTTAKSADNVAEATGTITFAAQTATLKTTNNDIFEVSDTILVKGVKGYEADGVTTAQELVLYVCGKNDDGSLLVNAVNGKKLSSIDNCVPSIPLGKVLVRMGRAATELDVQTAQYEALPQKSQNYCQIFKMQVEQSTLQKLSNKEADWDISDQEEAAIFDMRMGMEKSFLFGARRKMYDTRKHETVMFTGGIWHQAGKEFVLPSSFTDTKMIELMREAFTGNAGNKRKVLIGGSELIGKINNLSSTKVVTAQENVVKWGIDFSEIRSKFGRLYVLMSEVFDECGMAGCGMIIDPEYLQKWSHIPFSTQQLDLKGAGLRNTDAVVITESSCLTLRYPTAHMRIVDQAS